jgi:cell fate regulator YaaT (PSP1 superfamily)
MLYFYIRLGALGEIHRAAARLNLQRGQRVIVRTRRGVELAEVVSRSSAPSSSGPDNRQTERQQDDSTRHRILRATTEQDELLIKRLDRHKRTAIENCRRELADAGCSATLLDVDHLFDGGTLVMHFLGPVDELVESITQRVVAEYEAVVRSRHLSKLLRDGCGPGCGDREGGGCGTTGCSSGACAGCAVAASARSPR